MSTGSNGVWRVATLLRSSYASYDSAAVCRSCQKTLNRRGYASVSVASGPSSDITSPKPASSSSSPSSTATTTAATTSEQLSASIPKPYTIKAGAVLSRTPRLTRELSSFEKAFFFYQRRLNERLALPFTRYFYFKRNTPADVDWKRKYQERLTPSRDIGKYSAYSKDAWNDELLVGAPESEPQHQVDALVRDAEGLALTESSDDGAKVEDVPKPLPRITEADKNGDEKSLDRLLSRTIYLLVKSKEGKWHFPAVPVEGKESLRTAAERGLFQSAGPNMNAWMVGYHPIGHFIYNINKPKTQLLGEKTFFLKGRIMAGQANVAENVQGVTDFKWLAKDEVQKHVTAQYWSAIKNMLVER